MSPSSGVQINSTTIIPSSSSNNLGFTQQQAQSMSSISQQYSQSQSIQLQENYMNTKNFSVESDEGDIEDNKLHSSSSRSNISDASIDHSNSIHSSIMQNKDYSQKSLQSQRIHQFLVRTFSSPTKCNFCTSIMIGLTRQGVGKYMIEC
jgi:serine/threonine-protein kinase MRCK